MRRASLPEEHVQLLRRFDPLREEITRFREINALMDSGIISRVRELKQWLDSSLAIADTCLYGIVT
jgi:hypothetical protein